MPFSFGSASIGIASRFWYNCRTNDMVSVVGWLACLSDEFVEFSTVYSFIFKPRYTATLNASKPDKSFCRTLNYWPKDFFTYR